MKIVVLNGSPKGEYSVTLQYVHYIQKKFPGHEWKIVHVSHHIKKLEQDEDTFQEIIDDVRSSDGVLWAFGLWVLAAPAQYMRFIELITERGVKEAFNQKYAAVMTTSIHYYDHTAHNYLRAVCEDLNMRYAEAISLDMIDIQQKAARKQIDIFAESFFNAIEQQRATTRVFPPLPVSTFIYQPAEPEQKLDAKGKKVLVLTDAYDTTTNLGKMIDRFTQSFSGEVDVINLNDIDIRGACLGCMRCGYDYTCVYKDGFKDFYNNRVRTADIIVFAGTMQGRYLSSTWKTFYDRAFFWNHTPSLVGKQFGYLISGPLSHNANLIQILEASSISRQHANHVDIITDESEHSADIDAQLQSLAERLVSFAEKGCIRPQNFLGVGGHKVFRDNIWGRLRAVWQADHRYFKTHKLYDFPQKNYGLRILIALLMGLTMIPPIRKRYYAKIKIMPSKRLKSLIERMT